MTEKALTTKAETKKATPADVRGVIRGKAGSGKPFGGNKQEQVASRTATWGICTVLRAEQQDSFVCGACLGKGGSKTRKTAIRVREESGEERLVGETCAVALAELGRLVVPA